MLDLAHAAIDGSLQCIVLAALELNALGSQLPHPQNDLQQAGAVASLWQDHNERSLLLLADKITMQDRAPPRI